MSNLLQFAIGFGFFNSTVAINDIALFSRPRVSARSRSSLLRACFSSLTVAESSPVSDLLYYTSNFRQHSMLSYNHMVIDFSQSLASAMGLTKNFTNIPDVS